MGLAQHYIPDGPSLDACHFCGCNTVNCQCMKFQAETSRSGVKMNDMVMVQKLKTFGLCALPLVVTENDGRDATNSDLSVAGLSHSVSNAQGANVATSAATGMSGATP